VATLRRRIAAAGVLSVWVAVAGLAPAAGASEFTINACQADRTEFSTRAFEDFANRGMMWKRACDPEGPGLRGLVTSNVVRSGRVVRGSRSYFMLEAPAGTQFSRFTWSGQARRRDCRYALQLWADRPNGQDVAIKNVRANRGCPNPGHTQAAGWPSARTYDIAGSTKIVQRVLCVGSAETPYCSARGLNYIRTFKAAATVVDVSAPGVTITQDTPFTRGEWVKGTQQVNYAVLDNVGVRVARAIVGGVSRAEHTRPCSYSERIPCTNGSGTITVDTTPLPEGTQPLVVHGEDAAGNANVSGPTGVRIDNTAPGAVATAVTGGDQWRRENGFDVAWTNPDEGDRAPVVAAHYRLCPAAGGDCVTGTQAAHGIQRLEHVAVPRPGEWQLRVWREDAATNQEPANASVPVALRYDPDPPELGFEQDHASDPTLVSAAATDTVSGVAGGEIEISRVGSGLWEVLPTHQNGNRLSARIDDARLPPGTYVLRATARDRAANQISTDRRLDGSPMVLTLPLRTATTIRAGIVAKRGGGGRRSELAARSRVRLGSKLEIVGRVTGGGVPMPQAEVQVLARNAHSGERGLATLHTDRRGRFSYVTRASSTTVFRLVYAGTPTTLPSQSETAVLVPAASTISVRPRRVRNGQAVTFIGRLRSVPPPPAGKLVELQVVLSKRWQTFRTVRARPDGTWRVRYRFRRSCGLLRYRFRARLPAEAGYPFETGQTRDVAVLVRGRPCR
jgi:hypothetical protein